MGLEISTMTINGHEYKNTYHRITFGERDKKTKRLIVIIKVYSDKNYADNNIDNFIFKEKLYVNNDDFDLYFDNIDYVRGEVYPEKAAYEFIKTINPKEKGSKYSRLNADYKNKSKDL